MLFHEFGRIFFFFFFAAALLGPIFTLFTKGNCEKTTGRRSNTNFCLLAATHYTFIISICLFQRTCGPSTLEWVALCKEWDHGLLCFDKSNLIMPLACTIGGAGVEVRVKIYIYIPTKGERVKKQREKEGGRDLAWWEELDEKCSSLCGQVGVTPSSVTYQL